MANIRSAMKSVRKDKKKAARKVAVRSAVKTAFKKATLAISSSSRDMEALVRSAISVIDKAVENGILHRNTSARKKSRLLKKYNMALKK